MEGDSTIPLLFCPQTDGRLLQCADTHYCGEERTSDLSTFLTLHGQYAYTNGPKLEHKTWHSLFDFQVHICGKLHLCCQKTKSALSLPLIFEIEIFWKVTHLDRTIWNFGALFPDHMQNKTPALLTSNYRVQKVWVTFDRFNKVVSVVKSLFFLFGC